MSIHFKRFSVIMISAALQLFSCALADSITFSGTVAAVSGESGQRIGAEDVLLRLSTTKVYAEEAGTITGVFGQPGDNTGTVAEKYGAVMYLEGESVYTISASTDNAYNSTSTRFIHAGEEVYLQCYSDGSHTGQGVVTSIDGTDYTVRVTSGEFLIGETVSIYRGQSAAASRRIGRGTLHRSNPTAITGSGSIVSFSVSAGDTVARGELLFETLDGCLGCKSCAGSCPAHVDIPQMQIGRASCRDRV